MARYPSATWSRGKVRSKTLPGLIFPFHTKLISSGICEWDAQHRCLRGADELLVLAGSLIASLAVRAGIVGSEKRTNDKLAGLDRGDSSADLLDDAAVFVSHRGGFGDRLDATVDWYQVGFWLSAMREQAFKKARKHWGKLEAGVGIARLRYDCVLKIADFIG